MSLEAFFILLLKLQGFALALLLLIIVGRKIIFNALSKAHKIFKKKTYQLLKDYQNGKKIEHKVKVTTANFFLFLEALDDWVLKYPKELKVAQEFVLDFVLKKAKELAKHKSSLLRYYAAKAFLFYPRVEDAKSIRHLVKDEEFFVRIPAIKAAIQIHDFESLSIVLKATSKYTDYERAFLLDLLTQKKGLKKQIADLAEYEEEPKSLVNYLLYFSKTVYSQKLPFLERALYHEDEWIIKHALEAFRINPQLEVIEKVYEYTDHENFDVRSVAYKALTSSVNEKTLEYYKKGLRDPHWSVRKTVAFCIKDLKKEKDQFLKSLKKNKEIDKLWVYVQQLD